MNRKFGLIAAFAALAAASPVLAQSNNAGPVRTIRIAVSHHALATNEGRQALSKRVLRAAQRVCTAEGDHSLSATKLKQACVTRAVNDADAQLSRRTPEFAARISANSAVE